MKKTLTISGIVLLLFCFTNVSAQKFAKQGAVEVGGSISFNNITMVADGKSADESLSVFLLAGNIGYFITDGLELMVVPSYMNMSVEDVSLSGLLLYFAPAYVFDLRSNVFPFIQGMIGYNSLTVDLGGSTSGLPGVSSGEQTLSGLSYGGAGGIKVQLAKNALLNCSVSYMMLTLDPENWEGDRNGADVITVGAGFTVFFGR